MKSNLFRIFSALNYASLTRSHKNPTQRARLLQHGRRLSRRSRFFEQLEDRRLLATLYVDNPGDFNVTTDNNPPGLSNGDIVTWDPGPNSQHGAAVPNLVFGTSAFSTIQSAVNAATAGDTIRVAGGTFAEGVNINKQLFVYGNQVGEDAQAGRSGAPETIVTGAGNNGVTPFDITASDVELNGFTIEDATNANQFGFGILLGAGTSGSLIRDNIIQDNIAGLSLANASTTDQTQITGNLFQNNNQPGPVSGTGIYTDQFNAGGALNDVLIDNNTFLNETNVAVLIGPTASASPASAITISRNVITDAGNAVLLFNTLNSTITQNEISSSTGSQIVLGGGDNTIAVTQNFVSNGATNGIRIGDFGGGSPNQAITINRNSISGNATAGLSIDTGGYTGAAGSLNAEFNWWGSATGPTIASNPGGTGDAIVDALGQVDYRPFLTNGTDTQPTVRGFQPSIADLSITKTAAATAVPGNTFIYTIVVTNNGPDTQSGVTVADTFPTAFTGATYTSVASTGVSGNTASGSGNVHDTVTLPNGGTITYTVNGTISPTATGTLSNTATVTALGTTFETNTTNNTSMATTSLTPQADLSITKTDGVANVQAGSGVQYTIVVTNNGPSAVTGATVTDNFPTTLTGISYIAAGSGTASGFSNGTGNINQNVNLSPGATVTYTVNATLSSTATGSLSNTATVAAPAGVSDTNGANNSATDTDSVTAAQPDLTISKTDSPDPVTAGQNLTYTITVNNTGTAAAQNVKLSDTLPAGTTFVSLSAPSGWSNTTPTAGGTGTITSTRTSLAAGASPQTFTLVVKANSSLASGSTVTNTANISTTSTESNPNNDSATATTTVTTTTDVSITKTENTDTVAPGGNLIYTIVVHNNGPSDAQSVTATDVLPTGTTFVSGSQTSGPTFTLSSPPVGGTGTVMASAGTLAAGANATFVFTVQVGADVTAGTTISNTATVTTATSDTNPNNDSSSVTADVEEQVAGLPVCEDLVSIHTANEPGDLGTAVIVDDADNPGANALVVTGTNKNDVIVVEPQPKSHGIMRVVQNKHVIVTFISTDVQRIVIYGLGGNDSITVNPTMNQPSVVFGGSGNDTIVTSGGDSLADGGDGNDTIVTGRGNDQVSGGNGNDVIVGGDGNDALCGDAGNDVIHGGNGDDTLFGEAGNDKLYGDAGNDLLLGGDGNDFLYGSIGNDQLFGQAGNDQLFGDAGNDIVIGGLGNDQLHGSSGRDILIGSEGVDTLYGEADDDILIGDATMYDENPTALSAVLAEWTSRDSYNTRVNDLRLGGGANGAFTLDSTSVVDDGAADTLYGAGGQDWFFMGSRDKIRDRAKNELTN